MDLIVINGAGEVKAAFPNHVGRLLPEIEGVIFEMIADFHTRNDGEPSRGLLASGSAVHLSLLLDSTGVPAEKMYAVHFVADRHRDCLARAISRYHLTNRQTDVLLHVIDGASAGDVARALGISEYTAQGYIKTLLTKTGSRNRTAMVAKVLEWQTSRKAPEAPEKLEATALN